MHAFRLYTRADLDRMVTLDRQCFTADFAFSRSAMKHFAEAPNAITLVHDDGAGPLTSFTIAQIESTLGYLVTLDVAPALRRTGIASKLMQEVERRASAAGAIQMSLHVSTQNEAAIRFYENQGYHPIGLELAYYGKPGLDAHIYTKIL